MGWFVIIIIILMFMQVDTAFWDRSKVPDSMTEKKQIIEFNNWQMWAKIWNMVWQTDIAPSHFVYIITICAASSSLQRLIGGIIF